MAKYLSRQVRYWYNDVSFAGKSELQQDSRLAGSEFALEDEGTSTTRGPSSSPHCIHATRFERGCARKVA